METQKPKRSLTDIIKKPLIAAATLATIATSTQSCAPGMYFSVQGRDQNTAYAIAVATQPATCYDYRYIPGGSKFCRPGHNPWYLHEYDARSQMFFFYSRGSYGEMMKFSYSADVFFSQFNPYGDWYYDQRPIIVNYNNQQPQRQQLQNHENYQQQKQQQYHKQQQKSGFAKHVRPVKRAIKR